MCGRAPVGGFLVKGVLLRMVAVSISYCSGGSAQGFVVQVSVFKRTGHYLNWLQGFLGRRLSGFVPV